MSGRDGLGRGEHGGSMPATSEPQPLTDEELAAEEARWAYASLRHHARRLIATIHTRDDRIAEVERELAERMILKGAERIAEVERERDEAKQNWRFQAEEARQMDHVVRDLRAKLAAAEARAERLEKALREINNGRHFLNATEMAAVAWVALGEAPAGLPADLDAASPPEPPEPAKGDASSRRARSFLGENCTCYKDCGEDSASGDWHQHEDDPCPEHPDAPVVG